MAFDSKQRNTMTIQHLQSMGWPITRAAKLLGIKQYKLASLLPFLGLSTFKDASGRLRVHHESLMESEARIKLLIAGLMTTREAAKRCGVGNASVVRKWATKYGLRRYGTLIHADDLAQFLKTGRPKRGIPKGAFRKPTASRGDCAGHSDTRTGYVYLFVDPVDGSVRYVGQTVHLSRLWDHHASLVKRKHFNPHFQRWFNGLQGMPIITVAWEGPASRLDTVERWMIRKYRRLYPGKLCNIDNGGARGAVVAETRKKISDGVKRRYQNDPDYKRRVVESNAGNGKRYLRSASAWADVCLKMRHGEKRCNWTIKRFIFRKTKRGTPEHTTIMRNAQLKKWAGRTDEQRRLHSEATSLGMLRHHATA